MATAKRKPGQGKTWGYLLRRRFANDSSIFLYFLVFKILIKTNLL